MNTLTAISLAAIISLSSLVVYKENTHVTQPTPTSSHTPTVTTNCKTNNISSYVQGVDEFTSTKTNYWTAKENGICNTSHDDIIVSERKYTSNVTLSAGLNLSNEIGYRITRRDEYGNIIKLDASEVVVIDSLGEIHHISFTNKTSLFGIMQTIDLSGTDNLLMFRLIMNNDWIDVSVDGVVTRIFTELHTIETNIINR